MQLKNLIMLLNSILLLVGLGFMGTTNQQGALSAGFLLGIFLVITAGVTLLYLEGSIGNIKNNTDEDKK